MARPVTAFVDGRAVGVAPGETLLQAALRQGVEFPHRCRVGACATCRCRLVEGRVRSLTETRYVLEDDELDRGVILACQSVPVGDVRVELEPATTRARRVPAPWRPPAAPADTRRPARPADFLKYSLFHGVGLVAAAALVAGGAWISAGLLAIVAFYVVGDALCGDDTSTPEYARPQALTLQLWLALPLVALVSFAATWSVSPGDPLGFGALVERWTGFDALAAREATTLGHHVSAWLLTGLMIGMVGTIPAHELVHRTWDPVSQAIGRGLLAFSFDTVFAIEHVYGHHRHVATRDDPATAPRGRSVYRHVLLSTLRGNGSAWRIETRRLRRRGHGPLHWRNAVLRGYLASLALVAAAWAMGGAVAAAFFVACGLLGKALLEIVNYMEHYGLARDPRGPVMPRHSWNTNRRLSSWSTFNLTRHSHHHAQGEAPFHELRPLPEAPTMVAGYLTTILLTLVPPLWRRLMAPKLAEWDSNHATADERRLAAEAVEA